MGSNFRMRHREPYGIVKLDDSERHGSLIGKAPQSQDEQLGTEGTPPRFWGGDAFTITTTSDDRLERPRDLVDRQFRRQPRTG